MKTIIKIEECALLILAFLLSMRLGFDWWLFVVLLFLPDISIAGYILGKTVGTAIYNLFHFKAVAAAIALAGLYLGNNVVVLAALVLFGHSSLDRVFGFGLKFPDNFNHTHLGMIGKDRNPISMTEKIEGKEM